MTFTDIYNNRSSSCIIIVIFYLQTSIHTSVYVNQDCTINEEYRAVTKGNRFPEQGIVELEVAQPYDKPIVKQISFHIKLQTQTKLQWKTNNDHKKKKYKNSLEAKIA